MPVRPGRVGAAAAISFAAQARGQGTDPEAQTTYGRVRGLKVRLTSTARVEGDIIHKTIAIESGAHFEGSVQRQEDPLANGRPAGTVRLDTPAAASDAE